MRRTIAMTALFTASACAGLLFSQISPGAGSALAIQLSDNSPVHASHRGAAASSAVDIDEKSTPVISSPEEREFTAGAATAPFALEDAESSTGLFADLSGQREVRSFMFELGLASGGANGIRPARGTIRRASGRADAFGWVDEMLTRGGMRSPGRSLRYTVLSYDHNYGQGGWLAAAISAGWSGPDYLRKSAEHRRLFAIPAHQKHSTGAPGDEQIIRPEDYRRDGLVADLLEIMLAVSDGIRSTLSVLATPITALAYNEPRPAGQQ